MRLVRWNPARSLSHFDHFFNDFGNSDTVWHPSVDIVETENGFELKAEVPGLTKKDLKISIEDDLLTISGEKKFENEDKGKNYHRIERSYGSFERSFHIPRTVKSDDIKADYKNGVLTVNIPKSEEVKPKEIAVQ